MPRGDRLNFLQLTLHELVCCTDVSEHLRGGRVGEALHSSPQVVTRIRLSQELVGDTGVQVPALESPPPGLGLGQGARF